MSNEKKKNSKINLILMNHTTLTFWINNWPLGMSKNNTNNTK